ncbi:MAG TPA: hypothetical protein VIK86_08735 [Candidatus Paceibacterota bacterium]
MQYKGYVIEVKDDPKNKEYPYIGIGRKGIEVIKKRGYDKEQAIGLVQGIIDFTLGVQEINKAKKENI